MMPEVLLTSNICSLSLHLFLLSQSLCSHRDLHVYLFLFMKMKVNFSHNHQNLEVDPPPLPSPLPGGLGRADLNN